MQSWVAKRLISYLMARLRAGDVRPTLAFDAPDVELTFPGQSSWSGVFRGKAEVRQWLERFAAVGLQIYADEVVAKGWAEAPQALPAPWVDEHIGRMGGWRLAPPLLVDQLAALQPPAALVMVPRRQRKKTGAKP